MKTSKINKLLFKTAFSCMACDGDIDKKEVELIRTLAKETNIFEGVDVETELKLGIEGINKNGFSFLSEYFNDVEKAELNINEEFDIIKVAVATIYADEKIEYSELKFFKVIKMSLKITKDDMFNNIEELYSFVREYNKNRIKNIPEFNNFKIQMEDDFCSQDIFSSTYLNQLKTKYFESIELPKFSTDILEKK